MTLRLQSGLLITLAMIGAVWSAFSIANESYLVPGVCLLLGGLVLAAWWQTRFNAILVAGALLGYIVGNRGFAQLMLFPSVPLLVAEMVLAFSMAAIAFNVAVEKRVPYRNDFLNGAVLFWLTLGGIRLVADLRAYGFVAVRDSAMCYYALFFFIGQSVGAEPIGRRWLLRSLTLSLVLLPVFFAVWLSAPDFLMGHLLVHGVPLVFYKADLAATILAAGVFYFFWLTRKHRLAWIGVVACFIGAILPLTRAAVVALAVGLGWHLLARRWRLALGLTVVAAIAGVADLGQGLVRKHTIEGTRTLQVAQYAASILPFTDARSIDIEAGDVKGNPVDNNMFRLVWWRTIADETWHDNPVFGLGFGYDLASDFLVEYGLLGDADFSARSPHSILMSAFGRMGLLGACSLLALIAAMTLNTWRSVKRWQRDESAGEAVALWCMSWVIFVSACFGVVLEGPMGAVVFWIVLGLAHASVGEPAVGDESAARAPQQPAALPA